jgi:predicted DNA-binding transcriptional regulator YafY
MPASPRDSRRNVAWRLTFIHQQILSGQYPNASRIGDALEMCPKTIHRDLDFMRDFLGLPMAFDQSRNGFYYTAPVAGCPTCAAVKIMNR